MPTPDTRTHPPFTSIARLGRPVIVLLTIVAAVCALDLASDLMEIRLIDRAPDISLEELEANTFRQSAMAILYLLVLLPTAITFLVWFFRAHRNLEALGATSLRHTPRWAVLGFIVPVLNFIRPMQVMSEVWRETMTDPSPDGARDLLTIPNPSTPPVVATWWVLWLLSEALSRFSAYQLPDQPTLYDVSTAARMGVLENALAIPAAILAAVIVYRVSRRQEERGRRVGVGV